jgi:hypothetical protein
MAEAVLCALQDLWKALQPLNLPMAVMGGIAMSAWKGLRATRDVDLLLGLGSESSERVIQRLAATGFRPKRQPPVLALGRMRIIQLLYEPPGAYLDVQVDLVLADIDYQRVALNRRVPLRLPDVDTELSVLACEDLILHKLLAGRIIDRADVATLLRANADALDQGYIQHWTRELGVSDGLAEAWTEAFPGSAPPQR